MPARPLSEPLADQRRLVRGVVVHDQVHIEIVRYRGLDLIEKFAELGGAMSAIALANDPPRRDVEGSKQRSRAVTGVIMAAPCRLSRPHRQHRLAAVKRLYLGLLVHTENDGMLWR
jgi:hypothetical protein